MIFVVQLTVLTLIKTKSCQNHVTYHFVNSHSRNVQPCCNLTHFQAVAFSGKGVIVTHDDI